LQIDLAYYNFVTAKNMTALRRKKAVFPDDNNHKTNLYSSAQNYLDHYQNV